MHIRYQRMCEFAHTVKPRLVQQLRLESPPGRADGNPLSPSRIHVASTQAKHMSWIGMWDTFKSFVVALKSAVPPGMRHWFWFTIFIGGGILVASTWPFPP